jgi:hypothetical protein
LAEGEAFCGKMSLLKGKIRRDTNSFAWDMGYGRANEKGGRERKASGSREGRGKKPLMVHHSTLLSKHRMQGRGSARPVPVDCRGRR